MSFVIGICGGSCSGKSAMAGKISKMLNVSSVCISQDAYYCDLKGLTPEEKANVNYDSPSALDNELFFEHLKMLKEGKAIDRPDYSYITSTRTGATRVEPAEFIFVDGLFLYNFENHRDVFDKKIFISADEKTRIQRMLARDVLERGRTEQMVMNHYFRDVKPAHDTIIEGEKEFADFVINGNSGMDMVANTAAIVLEIDKIQATIKQ